MPFQCSMLLTFSQGLLHLGSSQLCPDETFVSLERKTGEVSKSALLCGCHFFQHHYFKLNSETSEIKLLILRILFFLYHAAVLVFFKTYLSGSSLSLFNVPLATLAQAMD